MLLNKVRPRPPRPPEEVRILIDYGDDELNYEHVFMLEFEPEVRGGELYGKT